MSSHSSINNGCILLVKTDENFVRLANYTVKPAGYNLVVLSNPKQALEQIGQLKPAMLIFDYSLSGEEGLELSRQLRRLGHSFPILMLVAQETLAERIACLEAGADDYILKPINSHQFFQLINIYLQPKEKGKEQLHFGELTLDLNTRKVFRQQQSVDLTMKEFELLKYLMSHPQEVLTREQILENVWGYDFLGESNVIEVYIRYLRLKLEQKGQKRIIHTVRGIGYVLKD